MRVLSQRVSTGDGKGMVTRNIRKGKSVELGAQLGEE